MRRHAKASTAGSTQRQAKSLGRFLRGVGATRGSSFARGSGAPADRRLALPIGVIASLIALLVFAIPASASKTHLFKEAFGSAAQPSFAIARSLAVDQSTGDVLVMDAGAGTISRFNPDGTPDDFAGLGSNVIDGQGAGDGTPQDGLGFASASESQIAVDNSGTATDGNIYVTQGSPKLINIFSAEGEYLGQLSESSDGVFNEACGVAVDSSGAVYVGDYDDGIHKYVPTANPPVNSDNTASFSSVTQPCSLAAGHGPTAGYIFAATYQGAISKLDSSSGELKYTVASGTHTTLTVDPTTGHVYVVAFGEVEELDASGPTSAVSISDFSVASGVEGVAVYGADASPYVSRFGAPGVDVFGPVVVLPSVATGIASDIEPTSAMLHGTVNPEGVELSECRFEYGQGPGYGQSVPCTESLTTIGAGTSDVAVSSEATGLELGAEYHFRLVAGNLNGAVNGGDETLKLKSPPVLRGEWASNVAFTETTLNARLNPEGAATAYKFEWGASTAYGHITPISGTSSDKADHTVSSPLSGLSPETTYHFRVVATNAIGTAESSDHTFITYGPAARSLDCPNQSFRSGTAAALPNCRAYELVTPIDKNGGQGWTPFGIMQSSPGGDKLAYASATSFGTPRGAGLFSQYISTRVTNGWSSENITPLGISLGGETSLFNPFYALDANLSSGWLWSFTPLNPGDTDKPHLYRLNVADGSYEQMDTIDQGIPGRFSGSSLDLEHQVFEAKAKLTPDGSSDPNAKQIYDLFDGELHLVSVLPNGEPNPTEQAVTGSSGANFKQAVYKTHVVSDDGSRVFWVSLPSPFTGGVGTVYVRENPAQPQSSLSGGDECTEPDKGCTVQLSSNDETRFLAASPDGSKVLLAGNENLSLVDVDTQATTLIAGELLEHNPGGFGENVSSTGVVGASEDLAYVYFVSREDLAAGATAGEANLYLDHEGVKTFVASLSALDTGSAFGNTATPNPVALDPNYRSSRVAPSGRHVVFTSNSSELAEETAGFDNTDAARGESDLEVYLYAAGGDLTCVSCNPSGARPTGDALRRPFRLSDNHTFGESGFEISAAAWLPTAEDGYYAPRALSEDGSRVFFNSYDALLPQDTNSRVDVYQWEATGAGDCEKFGGCLSLISTGKSSQSSEFVDADADGSDVFFHTLSGIDPRDPGSIDIYDARVGGGFAIPTQPPPCVGDACQSIPPAPNDRTPASASFHGAENSAVRKPQRRCSSRVRRAGKRHLKHKRAQRCKRTKRGAGR